MTTLSGARNTYWDPRFKRNTVKLLPGEYYATTSNNMLVTVLGSCVAACIRDTKSGIGGMNHFLLPQKRQQPVEHFIKDYDHPEMRYGDMAMEILINGIMKKGGNRRHFEAKIFGGAQMFESVMEIGKQNITFVKEYLDFEEIPITANDLGGEFGRKIYFIPKTGDVFLKRINKINNNTIKSREMKYLEQSRKDKAESQIDFF
ncbi:MAG: chemoreceptor glutamine deamidase CheD [Gammaproteobacteria bacterium]|nr:chemoreceptor glutamine deamidase CheD [Gammaproteobacteria bacterium]